MGNQKHVCRVRRQRKLEWMNIDKVIYAMNSKYLINIRPPKIEEQLLTIEYVMLFLPHVSKTVTNFGPLLKVWYLILFEWKN